MKKAKIIKAFRYGGEPFPVTKKQVEMEEKVYRFAVDNGCVEVDAPDGEKSEKKDEK